MHPSVGECYNNFPIVSRAVSRTIPIIACPEPFFFLYPGRHLAVVSPVEQYRAACPISRSDAELQELVKKMGGDEAKIQSALDDWWQSKIGHYSYLYLDSDTAFFRAACE